ncbi:MULTISPECIES: hypothetical protein [unclassified Leptolyngbya]|uniref:hypothetical protein n=1 Tax=unclassified Leptolyngbya TaxID=2650499 RepID=UPI0016843FEF|nr:MULTISPECIES: hypothetical protein [unclassified Leptolyngbya]MBD1913953.1 hypothetical protein [Leptolyngbya sp. FACHB-8]MBD2155920.1 hypothetical protein [Leptolyngbya sp. FACHB-16]
MNSPLNSIETEPQSTQSPSPDELQENMSEELEESSTTVKDELERLESRLEVVEDQLSHLNSNSCLKVSNPRMAAFHHVYDPAHRTW